jgi:hypothetical protein
VIEGYAYQTVKPIHISFYTPIAWLYQLEKKYLRYYFLLTLESYLRSRTCKKPKEKEIKN